MTTPAANYEELLHEAVAEYYADPLGFVLGMFTWGEPGQLELEDGPDEWQTEFLVKLGEEVAANGFDGQTAVKAIRLAVSSGHGIGKSVMVAWLICWLMSTRPHCRISVTANTINQLDTKTWATLRRWVKLCRTGHWFHIDSEKMYRLGFPESWFCAKQSSREQNSEAFAGQHAKDSSSIYIFDEASAIPEKIYEVAEGGLTDGEPFVVMFGNPTRTNGTFYRACFGNMQHRWRPVIIDSRKSRFTNKELIGEWVEDYGEDSDFVRVRVRGLPPKNSDLSFIGLAVVADAQRRQVVVTPEWPLVAGLDMARGGSDNCVLRFRRGPDARSIPPIVIPGERSKDSMVVASIVAEALSKSYGGVKVTTLFVDATGGSVGGPVADRLRQLGFRRVIDVQFGGESPDRTYANMRSYMWGRLRDWLPSGAIDETAILETDLTGPGFKHDKSDRILLESKEDMKKRGAASPDHGDGLALTFAQTVAPPEDDEEAAPARRRAWG